MISIDLHARLLTLDVPECGSRCCRAHDGRAGMSWLCDDRAGRRLPARSHRARCCTATPSPCPTRRTGRWSSRAARHSLNLSKASTCCNAAGTNSRSPPAARIRPRGAWRRLRAVTCHGMCAAGRAPDCAFCIVLNLFMPSFSFSLWMRSAEVSLVLSSAVSRSRRMPCSLSPRRCGTARAHQDLLLRPSDLGLDRGAVLRNHGAGALRHVGGAAEQRRRGTWARRRSV